MLLELNYRGDWLHISIRVIKTIVIEWFHNKTNLQENWKVLEESQNGLTTKRIYKRIRKHLSNCSNTIICWRRNEYCWIIPSTSSHIALPFVHYLFKYFCVKLHVYLFADTSYNIQLEQTLVTPIQVTSICGDVGDDWKNLAARLGLSLTDISNIDADGRESREKAYKVIEKWFKREGIEATVGRLINALEEIERKDAAQKLLSM